VPSLSMYLEWAVMRTANALGYKVMIDGQGADELLGGYQYYFQPYQQDEYLAGRRWQLRLDIWRQSRRLRRAARRYESPERRFRIDFALDEKVLKERGDQPFIDAGKYPGFPGLPEARPGNAFRHTLAAGLLYDSLPGQLHSADRNAMAFGVESRFPFLDYDLVDWCIRLPNRMMIRDGWQKYILRQAIRPVLPRAVVYRPDKVGYQPPQDRWLRCGLEEWIMDQLSSQALRSVPSFDRECVQRQANEHRKGGVDHSDSLWRWASLARWCSLFHERVGHGRDAGNGVREAGLTG